MKKFIRDVVLRAAEIIQERDLKARKEQTPPKSAIHDTGRPSSCAFCDVRPHVVVAVPEAYGTKQAFLCEEHLGPFIVVWTTAPELTVTRL